MDTIYVILFLVVMLGGYFYLSYLMRKELLKRANELLQSEYIIAAKERGKEDFVQKIKSFNSKDLNSLLNRVDSALTPVAGAACEKHKCVKGVSGSCAYRGAKDYNDRYGFMLGCEFCAFAKQELTNRLEEKRSNN